MTVKLYEIPIVAAEIEETLCENYGELTEELEQRIAAFLRESKDKIENAAMVVKSIEADAEVCEVEADRLLKRAAGLRKGADRLKGLMLYAVDEGFGGKVKTARFTVWTQTSAPVTIIELKQGADIYELSINAPKFVRTYDPELDKIALKEAVKAGEQLPDSLVVLEKPGTRFLRIR